MPAGRPSAYSEEIALEICTRLAEGEPLVKICRDEQMPAISAVFRWLQAHPEFRDMYARSREDQADTLADEIIDIADEDPGMGEHGVDSGAVQHQRLRVDARKFIAAKLKPRKYGELVKHEHGGADGAPIPVSITVRYERPGETKSS